MAGHSHAANIKHKKANIDAKRSKVWSKLSKAIIVAARLGGGDPAMNARLRNAVADARAVSMPRDNIERAIKKGIGELDGGDVEETLYEGYGPAGVAVMCDIMTDNKNRTAPEIRKIFELAGGKLGSTNCVAYLFERKGIIAVKSGQTPEDRLMEIALNLGAEDIQIHGDTVEIVTLPENFSEVAEGLEQAGVTIDMKQIMRIPATTVELDAETAKAVLKLLENLEDHDDVQSVSTNLRLTAEVLSE
ncbi:MAG: YebC/PmpR family DNA-binding transcriptional regulator [Planctomycetaceae bacterium]|nr:YebC/PmpR family DNA-binding transcriptional regulator [Planctomycetaceae bacterium]MBN8600762.1 YebC/PmpR family DNA-binding transcriptional regulator [Planctomycetota bacterium]